MKSCVVVLVINEHRITFSATLCALVASALSSRVFCSKMARFNFYILMNLAPAHDSSLPHLHRINLAFTFKVGAENYPFAIRGEMDIRLQIVIVMLHVHQSLRAQAVCLRVKEIEPHPVFRPGYLGRIAAVAAKEFLIRRDVKMDRPFVAFQTVSHSFAGFHIHTGQEKCLPSWNLQIVPYRVAVAAP